MAHEAENITVKYLGKAYDVTRLKKYHPGGGNTLKAYKGRDVTERLTETGHSPAAYDLLKEYSLADEDEQDLVDWSRPLMDQVGSLGKDYYAWMLKPVHKQTRLFESKILDFFTTTQWYVVALVWIPVVLCLVYSAHGRLQDVAGSTESYLYLVGLVLIGVLIWTITEYSVHRFLFHFKPPDNWPSLIRAHFLLHGHHHKVPFNAERVLSPPLQTAVFNFAVYSIYTKILPEWSITALLAGNILGYLAYDFIHMYAHHGNPSPGSYLYFMKRYHNHHHFVQNTQGFGVSVDLWDKVFNTVLTLKKLKITLKW